MYTKRSGMKNTANNKLIHDGQCLIEGNQKRQRFHVADNGLTTGNERTQYKDTVAPQQTGELITNRKDYANLKTYIPIIRDKRWRMIYIANSNTASML